MLATDAGARTRLTLQQHLNHITILHLEILGGLVVEDTRPVEEKAVTLALLDIVRRRRRYAPPPMSWGRCVPDGRWVLSDAVGVSSLDH